MKLVIRTGVFHIVCIIFFSILYYNLKDHFQRNTHQKVELLDYLLLSTTIQAGVGISDIYPISYYGKIVLITQQFMMMMTHILTLYFFTL